MALTDTFVKNVKPSGSATGEKYSDGHGLYLHVKPAGRYWRMAYRFTGKQKTLALGTYPEIPLAKARKRRDEARALLAEGIDPSAAKKAEKLAIRVATANTFEAVAREFHATKASGWSPRYATRWIERMEKDLFPHIGKLTLPAITAPVLLDVLRKVEKRGANETAHTLRQTAGQVFRYGIATGRCERNPAPDLHGALMPVNVKHMAAVLDAESAGKLMRSIFDYEGQPSTRAAMELSALLFQRPGNIRHMEWAEIDLDAALWTIPADKMKRTIYGKTNGRPHFVPLAPRAIQVLNDLKPLTGHGRYVFPSLLTGERAMSENTIRTALRRMGYTNDEMTPHGFRAMARTIMVERLNMHPDVIEAQLAHGKSGPLGAAYDRAQFMEQRRKMMMEWADYLHTLRTGANVIPLRA